MLEIIGAAAILAGVAYLPSALKWTSFKTYIVVLMVSVALALLSLGALIAQRL